MTSWWIPSSTPGNENDYGYFQVNTRYTDSYTYGTTYLGKGLVGAGNLVSTTGQWGHVSFILDNGADAQAVRALTFEDYNDSGRAIVGPETIYIDNLKVTPPPAVSYLVLNRFDTPAEVSGYAYSAWNGSPGTFSWSTNDAGGSVPTSGSMEMQITYGPGENGGAIYSTAPAVDVSKATALEFDLMVDPASPVDPNGNAFYFQIGFNSPSYNKIGNFWLGPSGNNFTPGVWQHFKLGITPGSLGTGEAQLFINPYDTSYTSPTTPIVYIDNIVFDVPVAPPPPPTLTISKPVKGLNVFYSSDSYLYYRQDARLVQNTGKSWVGHATAGNPVSYSFTINSFPQATNTYSCVAFLFLVPNPAAQEGDADYAEANCVLVNVAQYSATNGFMNIAYKINEPDGNAMIYGNTPYTNAPGSWDGVTTPWYESGNLGGVTNVQGTAVGTWTVKFTESDTNVTLIAPDGNAASYVIPPYNVGNFAESSGFDVYLGAQIEH